MRIGALALAFGLVVACGSVAGHVEPTPSAAPADLTNSSDGDRYAMHVGDQVTVSLQQESGFTPWSHPVAADPQVLQPMVDTRAAAVRGATLARFRAAAPGTTTLTSTASVLCSPGQACSALARAWRVTITVT